MSEDKRPLKDDKDFEEGDEDFDVYDSEGLDDLEESDEIAKKGFNENVTKNPVEKK